MRNKIASLGTVLSLLIAVGPAWAMPPSFSLMSLQTPGTSRTLVLPDSADQSPVIVPLGEAVDVESGKVVEGYAFINYKPGYHHRPGHSGGPGANGGSKCFAYLSQGAKWKNDEPWVMNPANLSSLAGDVIFANQAANLTKWEDAAEGVVGNGVGVEIFGDGTLTATTLVADTVAPDGQNEVYFADVAQTGAIAVTIVWGIFSGPPFQRELVEWDQVYDDVDFGWSLSGEAGKMDFENIATHEDGHSAGMGHPDDSCTEETMYRFADFGEIKKRNLHTGDIAGIDRLY